MDFLGHKTPTMLGLMQKASGVTADEVPLHDDGVMSLFYSPVALGVREEDIFAPNGLIGIPEFGAEFVMGIVKAVRPTTVEELMRIQGWAHGHGVWPDNVEKLLREQKAAAFDLPGTRDDITSYLTRQGRFLFPGGWKTSGICCTLCRQREIQGFIAVTDCIQRKPSYN